MCGSTTLAHADRERERETKAERKKERKRERERETSLGWFIMDTQWHLNIGRRTKEEQAGWDRVYRSQHAAAFSGEITVTGVDTVWTDILSGVRKTKIKPNK